MRLCKRIENGFILLLCAWIGSGADLSASETAPVPAQEDIGPTNFVVNSYAIQGKAVLATNTLPTLLAPYTGENVSLGQIVEAADAVQEECRKEGFPSISVSISQKHIANGVVPMYLFQSAQPHIFVSGKRWFSARESAQLALAHSAETNTPQSASKKAGPKFDLKTYVVSGNTLLSPETIKSVLFHHTGTNISVDDILKAGADLQREYRDRGYPTVNVTIPPQQISNGVVKIRVFEGRLAEIQVKHNRYFSSNNVMRALPSLQTNVILNGPILTAELNRANNSQDRQIYAKLEPGPAENTTVLVLDVKDQLPLHGKVEFNNEYSPGTPVLRVNTSAVYDNLWQEEHSLGVSYSFSPQQYKTADNWNFYDRPMVANYSGFYRLPIGGPEPLEQAVETSAGNFGFSEATRKFTLPIPSGQPELNFYASRATIDSGLSSIGVPLNGGGVSSTTSSFAQISQETDQQDLTINQDLGSRITWPLPGSDTFQSSITAGFDYKTFEILSHKTNNFTLTLYTVDQNGNVVPTNQTSRTIVPLTHNVLDYLPVSFRYDATVHDSLGFSTFGLGITGNPWHSGTDRDVQAITGSAESTGYYVVLNPAVSREFDFHVNWALVLRADGQWSTQPLVNNEQFGAGGVNSVRGYHEGEVFGDNGWHASIEQKTAPYVLGSVWKNNPLTIRASVFSDFAETYLIDPQGRQAETPLWGIGTGFVAAVGPHFEAHFIVSWPMLRTSIITPHQPYFNFALNAQF